MMSESVELDQEQKITLPMWLRLIAIGFTVMLVFIIGSYISAFWGNPVGDPVHFGQFGDYVGGLLNPILSFFTIFLLVWSITIQVSELRATNNQLKASKEELANSARALNETRKAHEAQHSLARREALRAQIYDALNHHYTEYQSLFNRPVFNRHGHDISIKMALTDPQYEDIALIQSFFERIPQIINDNSSTQKPEMALLEMRNHAGFIATATAELYGVVDSNTVASSWSMRTDEIIGTLHDLRVLNQEEFDVMKAAIVLPDRFVGTNRE